MNTNFNPERVVQTHYKEVPAHPINGPKHWEVVGRGIGPNESDVVIGRDPNLGDALRKASTYLRDNHPGYVL